MQCWPMLDTWSSLRTDCGTAGKLGSVYTENHSLQHCSHSLENYLISAAVVLGKWGFKNQIQPATYIKAFMEYSPTQSTSTLSMTVTAEVRCCRSHKAEAGKSSRLHTRSPPLLCCWQQVSVPRQLFCIPTLTVEYMMRGRGRECACGVSVRAIFSTQSFSFHSQFDQFHSSKHMLSSHADVNKFKALKMLALTGLQRGPPFTDKEPQLRRNKSLMEDKQLGSSGVWPTFLYTASLHALPCQNFISGSCGDGSVIIEALTALTENLSSYPSSQVSQLSTTCDKSSQATVPSAGLGRYLHTHTHTHRNKKITS